MLSSICLALVFVCSKLFISSILSKIVASSASDNFLKTSSSLLISSASNSLISVTYFLIDSSNSGCSIFTTIANNWSSKPFSVTIKLINVHWATISGL